MAPLVYRAATMGHLISKALNRSLEGHVLAVFRSSFYLEAEQLLFCFGTSDMPPGPLNVVTSASPATDWKESGLRKYAPAIVSKAGINVGGKCLFQLSGARQWRPVQIHRPISMAVLEKGLAAFKAKAADVVPNAGFGRLIFGGHISDRLDHACRAAKPNIFKGKLWFHEVLADEKRAEELQIGWAKKLVGLGHGLTPSGDDFLGGAMIALHAIGKGEICSLLWSKIGSYVAASTNSISLAHLRAASDGMGSDWIHRALSTIASGDVHAMEEPIAGIGRIGYSSGWDIVSGSIAVLDSWLDSECRNAANG